MEIICRYISKELWSVIHFAHDQYGGRQGTGNSTPGNLYENEHGFVKFFSSNDLVYIGSIPTRNATKPRGLMPPV
ncbi:hypothetical protein, partial [Candidatus Erwinia dacicola]|uniref:hypothetical protein n=1 Tax=Candidatus Erwinia dacicola TaxID=252393 RepID=UPI001C9BCFC4